MLKTIHAYANSPRRGPWRYFLAMTLTVAVLFGGVAGVSVVLDPYKVFGVFEMNTRNFEMNTRYVKIEHLKKNKYEGFILGSSGVNGFPVSTATALTGFHFYNMTVANDSHDGAYKKLKWLIKNQPVRHIILAASLSGQDKAVGVEHVNLAMFEHPEVAESSPSAFFWRYLWVKPRMLAIAFYSNFIKKDTWWKLDISTGHYHFVLFEKMIREKSRKELRDFRQTFAPPPGKNENRINPIQLDYFRKTIDLARKNNIRVTVIAPPKYPNSYLSTDIDTYGQWLREVVTLAGEIWDFSGINSVSTNEAMFFDTAHYSFDTGTLALRRIFQPDHASLSGHADFGFKVTTENVEQRIAFHRNMLATGQ